MIVRDNMLRGGRVVDPSGSDQGTQAIRDLNRRLADPRVAAVLLPVRDGMTLGRRAG